MNLLLDVGNSRIKWGCYERSRLDQVKAQSYERETLLKKLAGDFQELASPPEAVLVANVAGDEIAARLTELIERLWSVRPEFIPVQQQCCGLINDYRNIAELGVDRWLAALAVWTQYHQAACIVDCGTALTIDAINNKGEYQGGLIIPGPRLMQDVLIHRTSDISAPLSERYVKALGLSTAECIAHGAGLAACALIDSVTFDLKRQYGDNLCCVITGGAAEPLSSLLENAYIYEPDLVLKGLARYVGSKL